MGSGVGWDLGVAGALSLKESKRASTGAFCMSHFFFLTRFKHMNVDAHRTLMCATER